MGTERPATAPDNPTNATADALPGRIAGHSPEPIRRSWQLGVAGAAAAAAGSRRRATVGAPC
jgi:hypothetical protein